MALISASVSSMPVATPLRLPAVGSSRAKSKIRREAQATGIPRRHTRHRPHINSISFLQTAKKLYLRSPSVSNDCKKEDLGDTNNCSSSGGGNDSSNGKKILLPKRHSHHTPKAQSSPTIPMVPPDDVDDNDDGLSPDLDSILVPLELTVDMPPLPPVGPTLHSFASAPNLKTPSPPPKKHQISMLIEGGDDDGDDDDSSKSEDAAAEREWRYYMDRTRMAELRQMREQLKVKARTQRTQRKRSRSVDHNIDKKKKRKNNTKPTISNVVNNNHRILSAPMSGGYSHHSSPKTTAFGGILCGGGGASRVQHSMMSRPHPSVSAHSTFRANTRPNHTSGGTSSRSAVAIPYRPRNGTTAPYRQMHHLPSLSKMNFKSRGSIDRDDDDCTDDLSSPSSTSTSSKSSSESDTSPSIQSINGGTSHASTHIRKRRKKNKIKKRNKNGTQSRAEKSFTPPSMPMHTSQSQPTTPTTPPPPHAHKCGVTASYGRHCVPYHNIPPQSAFKTKSEPLLLNTSDSESPIEDGRKSRPSLGTTQLEKAVSAASSAARLVQTKKPPRSRSVQIGRSGAAAKAANKPKKRKESLGVMHPELWEDNVNLSIYSDSNPNNTKQRNWKSSVFHSAKIDVLKRGIGRIAEQWRDTNASFHKNVIFTLNCVYCDKNERKNAIVYPQRTAKHVRMCEKSSSRVSSQPLYRCSCDLSTLFSFEEFGLHWLEHATYYKVCLRYKANRLEDIASFHKI